MLVREVVEFLDEEYDFVVLSEDLFGGGVGGFLMGVKFCVLDRLCFCCICGLERFVWLVFMCDLEIVDICLGINIGFGL